MDLVSIFRRAGRGYGRVAAPGVALAVAAWVACGGFAPGASRVADGLVGAALLASGVQRVARRPRASLDAPPPLDTGLALLLVAAADAAVAFVGGVVGPLAALPLLAVALGVALADPRRAWLLAGYGALGELALGHARDGLADSAPTAVRALLVLVAGAVHHGLTRAEVHRVRIHARKILAEERQRQKEAAQSFRLVSPQAPAAARPSERDDESRLKSSLDAIHASTVGLLVLVRRTMHLRTCALFWADVKGRQLRLVEAATDDVELSEEPIAFGVGAVGGAASLARPVVLANLRPEYGGLTYYKGSHGVRAFAAVPVLDGTSVKGVLVADRAEDHPFDADDQATLEAVALQARRLIDNERVFARLERARDDLARLFQAARALGEALSEEQVLTAVVEASRAIVEHDLLVVTTYDARAGEHRVRHVEGDAPAKLPGLVFHDNAGIASAVAKTRHALPYKGQVDTRTQFVFTRDLDLGGCASVLCLPLVVRDRVIGTLTLASRRRNGFSEGARQLLGVLAGNASVALANAQSVHRLEELATTDAMTGLLNKRALETAFDRRLKSAERFSRSLAVVVLDIDHFKKVNDTYGHAVGDVVIKGLGAVLARCRRETDVIGRFGGEEFVLVCEETDAEGALLLAERVREELARQVFQSEKGPLQVTCSLGVAQFPQHGRERQGLFERADAALYRAKHEGRNRSRVADGPGGPGGPGGPPGSQRPRKARRTDPTQGQGVTPSR
jgi:diguanylate cyclase (GGDEF)-like protein